MTPEERDRLTVVEVKSDERSSDIKEIKALLQKMDGRLTSLEKVAATGGGALKTAFIVGSMVAWVVGLAVMITGLFKGH